MIGDFTAVGREFNPKAKAVDLCGDVPETCESSVERDSVASHRVEI